MDLIESIVKFTCKSLCLVLPSVDNDDDEAVLNPIVDWIKNNLKKKKKRATSAKRRHRKKVNVKTKKKMFKIDSDVIDEKSSFTGSKEVIESTAGHGGDDPFKRTGCLFGGLWKEMKIRYLNYKTDITDGLNMQCFVSFIFIFTVCFSPALTFGGILCKYIKISFLCIFIIPVWFKLIKRTTGLE